MREYEITLANKKDLNKQLAGYNVLVKTEKITVEAETKEAAKAIAENYKKNMTVWEIDGEVELD